MNFDSKLIDYTTWPECDCKVHRGVDRGVNGVYPQVLEEVLRLQAEHPDFIVEVNGHSLGGALAQLLSMKLLKDGIEAKTIDIAGFRVGDPDFAAFANQVSTDRFRVVNH
jgi:putative lipase involved disintegration of autophagic bodies